MTFLGARWCYLYLMCSCYATDCTGAVERSYQIPSFHEIVDKAMFIYDHRSPIQGATSQILPTSAQLLFPFMNFTCSGNITRLMFVASGLSVSSLDGMIIINQKPVFFLWHRTSDGDNFVKRSSMGIFNPDQSLSFNQPARVTDVGLVEVNFTPYVRFEAGDILGLRQQFITSSNLQSPVNIRVFRQRGGYGLTLICTQPGSEHSECRVREIEHLQQIPYIAIEITPPDQQCAMGFLNEQSLRMIVDAPRNAYSSSPFSFPGVPPMVMNIPFTQSGPLRKMVITARFNVSAPVGWPELQILRNASNGAGTSYVVFTTTTEPTPTGYLNVYEYDLTATEFITQAGDVLNISWRGDIRQGDQIRFSLAYYNNGTSPSIPMVSIVVGECTVTERSSTTTVVATEPLNTVKNSNNNRATNPNQGKTKSEADKSITTAVAIGVVSCSLLLVLFLITVVTIIYIVLRQRRKPKHSSLADSSVSMEANVAYGTHPPQVVDSTKSDTVPTEANVAYGTHPPQVYDYDYVNVDL